MKTYLSICSHPFQRQKLYDRIPIRLVTATPAMGSLDRIFKMTTISTNPVIRTLVIDTEKKIPAFENNCISYRGHKTIDFVQIVVARVVGDQEPLLATVTWSVLDMYPGTTLCRRLYFKVP